MCFVLVSSFNTVLDRIDMLGDKQEEMLIKNEELLRQAREQVLQRIIEEAVELEIEKRRNSG